MDFKTRVLRFPTECCKCMLPEATDSYVVETSFSYVGEGAYIREKHFSVRVPVCKDCADKMCVSKIRLGQVEKRVLLLCFLISVSIILAIFQVQSDNDWKPFAGVANFFGAFILSSALGIFVSGVFLWKPVVFLLKTLFPDQYDYSAGTFDKSGDLHFKNKAYDIKFRDLNGLAQEMPVQEQLKFVIGILGAIGGVILLTILFMYLFPE